MLRLSALLSGCDLKNRFPGLVVSMPKTLLAGTDAFEEFLDANALRDYAFDELNYPALRARFLASPLPLGLEAKLRPSLSDEGRPLIVRSSSRYEDAADVPFSGVYESYVIPNSHPDPKIRLSQLIDATRLVWASLFSPDARAYRDQAGCDHRGESMALVIQELAGARRGRWFYPRLSGTAQSHNYYPLSYALPEDGLCMAALGLGAWVVEGGSVLRFCPKYPTMNASPPELAAEGAQRRFLALDMERTEPNLSLGENAALEELDIVEAEGTGVLDWLVSTWDHNDHRLVPGTAATGMRVMDLAPILKYDALPLAETVNAVLLECAREKGGPVEIEYALDVDPDTGLNTFYLLQVKPLTIAGGDVEIDPAEASSPSCFIASNKALGNGRMNGIRDIIWVDPNRFDRSKTKDIAVEIATFNRQLSMLGRAYLLVGPGRWGTRDPWLGIPVTFPEIAGVAVIVETEIPGFSVDFSFGSHFLHNVTSLHKGYLAVPTQEGNTIDWPWLTSLPREREGAYCSCTALDGGLEVFLDGKHGKGLVRKPLGAAPK